MKKFSSLIVESEESIPVEIKPTKNFGKYELGKTIDGPFSPDFEDTLEMVNVFNRAYSDTVESCEIQKGYLTIGHITNSRSVNSTDFVGKKKLKTRFPDGKIPDHWMQGIKMLVKFKKFENIVEKKLPNWAIDELFETSTLDIMIDRYKSFKTLALRCHHYGGHTKISYGDNTISFLIYFD